MKALAASQGATNILTPYFWGSVRRASLIEAEKNQFSLLALTDNPSSWLVSLRWRPSPRMPRGGV